MTTSPVAKAKLSKLTTAQLIEQYELSISSYAGRHTDRSRRQSRINYIVDLLSDRADNDDEAALASRINYIVDLLSDRADNDDEAALAWFAN